MLDPSHTRAHPARLVGTPLYTAVEIGELLVILAMVDAGYSGDWSRIGVISTGDERRAVHAPPTLCGRRGAC